MPRLSFSFDTNQFLEHCRVTKPPYECPHASCGKVYRSLSGIQHHMTSYDHENPPPNIGTPKSGRKKNMKRVPSPGANQENEPQVPDSTDLNEVEFELDGKMTRLTVYDQLEIISKARPSDKEKGVDVQRYTIEEKKIKFPEPSFHIIPDYNERLSDDVPRMHNYIKYTKRTNEELDNEVEYDMDEEDHAWLKLMNEKRSEEGLSGVEMETFELLMDRLEKESFFQAQTTGRDSGIPVDENALCSICMDGDCQNSNFILFCDMCNLAVHQECYGVPYIPEGQWLCRRCLQSPSRAVDCALCPNKGGAFKQTDDGRWAHVACALWIPEVCFANMVFLEPIDSISNIPPARWKLTCYICKQRGVGACIQCNKVNCYTAFHVTCARQAGLHMNIDAAKETSSNGTFVTVRRAAYCDMHTPADSEARPLIEDVADGNNRVAAKLASREKMKKARKILAEKRSAAPLVSVPTIPPERIQKMAELAVMPKKSQFMHRLLSYWTLKRQSRNGVPLLRRLTATHLRRSSDNSAGSARNRSPSNSEKNKVVDDSEKLCEEIKYCQRLRQDLERARLLCEMIRNREKLKREIVKVKSDESKLKFDPFVHYLLACLDLLQEKDQQMIFAEPVDINEVPDYLDIVKHPMDLSTMRQKALSHQYANVEQFVADFDLMIKNCLTYNSSDTIFYKCGVKLRHQGGAIIRHLRRNIEDAGIDEQTGLFSVQKPKTQESNSDPEKHSESQKEEPQSLLSQEASLIEQVKHAGLIQHPVTRMKKLKVLRRELANVRRKLTAESSAEGGGRRSRTSSVRVEDDKSESDETHAATQTKSPVKKGPSLSGASAESSNKEKNCKLRNGEREEEKMEVEENEQGTGSQPPHEPASTAEETSPGLGLRKRKPGRPPKCSTDDKESPHENTADIDQGKSVLGVNRRTSVLFNKKAGSLCNKNETSVNGSAPNGMNVSLKSDAEATNLQSMDYTLSDPTLKVGEELKIVELETDGEPLARESFKVYRQEPRNETDEESHCESTLHMSDSDDETGSETNSGDNSSDSDSTVGADMDGVASQSGEQLLLEPLDLVWAKCRGYPWYPALIINPKMPKTGYFHNHEPIPVPPDEVLALGSHYEVPMYLVLFFDHKRTWQWLPRNKLEPLGANSAMDKSKLIEPRKPADRKAVKRAYEQAIMHKCRVTGENTGLSEDSANEN